ncbi:MAG: SH3 domain-containing protein [Candidatus Latescibacteria bacterium]|nr:SH3 domain-containing protein [Candidatus Latescibacterota bacterium]
MQKKRFSTVCYLCVLLLIFSSTTWSEEPKPRHAPDTLPGVEPEMLTPEYWIALQPDADEVIMTPAEIERFNGHVRNKKAVFKDRFGKPDPMISNYNEKLSIGLFMNPILPLDLSDTAPGDSLRSWLENNIKYLNSRDFYDNRNAIYSDKMKQEIVGKINIAGVPDVIKRRFGVIVNRADMRLFPTATPGFSETKWEMDFFQTTGVYTINPVSILYESVDGDYYYVESSIARGWMAAENIAIAPREEVRKLTKDPNFLMATGDKVPIYGDSSFKNFVRYFYLSAALPLIRQDNTGYTVTLPYRKLDGSLGIDRGYIKPDADVHKGYLPYTKRNVIIQIFKMLGQPYGWADQQCKRDCSGTQRVVINCFGIVTGRWPNFLLLASDHQTYIDPALSTEEKLKELEKIEPVITWAGTGGHAIMYLGKARNGKLYFIQMAGWGYEDENGENLTVNRVAVNSAEHAWYDVNKPRVFMTLRP